MSLAVTAMMLTPKADKNKYRDGDSVQCISFVQLLACFQGYNSELIIQKWSQRSKAIRFMQQGSRHQLVHYGTNSAVQNPGKRTPKYGSFYACMCSYCGKDNTTKWGGPKKYNVFKGSFHY